MLPYWPGDASGMLSSRRKRLWAINEATEAGFVIPEGLANKLRGALTKIVRGQLSASRFEQVFALFALSHTSTTQDFAAAAEELYLQRNEIGDEGRALLALALHRLEIMPKEQEQLLREIDAPIKPRAFDPLTFTSTTRAEAICTFAFATIAPKIWTPEKQKRVRDRLNVSDEFLRVTFHTGKFMVVTRVQIDARFRRIGSFKDLRRRARSFQRMADPRPG